MLLHKTTEGKPQLLLARRIPKHKANVQLGYHEILFASSTPFEIYNVLEGSKTISFRGDESALTSQDNMITFVDL